MMTENTATIYTEEEVVEMLMELIQCEGYGVNDDLGNARLDTFDEAGLLTRNMGIVMRLGGQEFQIEVLRAR